ncbi:alpha-(1,3)-fucosyltransferase 7 isoform X2 [Mugil cephalus]|uniref:alpha-(1,3)-fucosyltransferase 7 isoform X2 n=1 Tax=Mugil cephalus TaxID=48193 RepID=UPI001FB59719|nr:alpha-(1,3)-fucosyltransferase 7 isoform X2 [Mugil cephalus]XP_047426271.1 alpha-(1,3)-fucosyltransferase 7 isoform X2 [Mugil cephalus]
MVLVMTEDRAPCAQKTSPSPIPDISQRNNGSGNVTILLWHWPFGRPLSLRGDVCWDRYRIPHCKLVDQRSLFPLADIVVFHNTELAHGSQELPLELPRPKGQRWAWMSLEAPANNGNLKKYANIFNMTISYRRDADVSVPYGELLLEKTEGYVVEDNSVNKSSLVCWVVSNYGTQQKRSQVYQELSATVPVKVYGNWKNAHLPSRDLLPVISRCYFYLAFENSVAKDYITEKLWRNSYQGGALPVVLGPETSDYEAVAPPHSFIHVDEFASVKELGAFLQQLAKDKKHYNEYFAWKRQWKVKLYKDWRERLCKICLQYKSLPQQKVYSDLEAWAYLKST